MNQMFTIPPNIILVITLVLVGVLFGYVIYGCVKGWENVTRDYKQKKEELTIDG